MTDEAMSPLRRRMIEDMTIRKLSPKTQQGYIRTIKNLAVFLGRSPDTASFEDIRCFQLHLASSGAGTPILNQTVAALRFFFRVTLKRHAIIEHTAFIHEPRKLPVVLSPEEVAHLLDAAPRHGAGIRKPSHFPTWVVSQFEFGDRTPLRCRPGSRADRSRGASCRFRDGQRAQVLHCVRCSRPFPRAALRVLHLATVQRSAGAVKLFANACMAASRVGS